MRYFYTLLVVFFISFTSWGQTFTLSELIKMSKMNVDDFDTYVTAKGFVFSKEDKEDIDDNSQGVEYAFELNRTDRTKALKFLTLYQKFYWYKYAITYQTINKKEYLAIKNQIKALGFKLEESNFHTNDEGITSNHFVYKKGKARISIYASSIDFEINYQVDY